MNSNGNDIVSSFIGRIAWEKLPPAVQRKARMALLDTLGATLAGTLTPVSRITAEYAAETCPATRRRSCGTAKPDGQPRRSLDISRAQEEFGFEARVPFEEGLRRTIEWYREVRAGNQVHRIGEEGRLETRGG